MSHAHNAWYRTRQSLEFHLARLGMAVLPRLSRPAILRLARLLGALGWIFSRRERAIGFANLDLAFGDTKSAAEKKQILRASLTNFAQVTLDLFWFSRHSTERMARWVKFSPDLAAQTITGRACVGVTGHYGDWEIIGRYWGATPNGLTSVAMPVKNPRIGDMLLKARCITGQQIVAREGALKKLVKCLHNQGTIGLLLDQNTHPNEGGVWVDFFGYPVAVSPAAGSLAALTRSDIMMGIAIPCPDGSYACSMPLLIPAAEVAAIDRKSAPLLLTQRITATYEKLIRETPEYWLWCYKRWRWIPPNTAQKHFPFYAKPVP